MNAIPQIMIDDTKPEQIRPQPGDKMSGADALIHVLAEKGVDTVFGYPGGAIMPIYDAYHRISSDIAHVLATNEGAAGHAAEGYARSSGKTGVLFVTSGPGMTNAVTPIADAMGDSIPMVVISGQVSTALIGTDAFQEVDATGVTGQITKFNKLVRVADDLIPTLREAFALAASGRPGPVHIDIPKDIQNAQVTWSAPAASDIARAMRKAVLPQQPEHIRTAVELMSSAKRPVLYVGGGVINAGDTATQNLMALMQETGFPATSTLMGLGAYPTTHPSHLGMLGMHGTYEANMAMHQADLIIAVGARFDDRVTGSTQDFAPYAQIIHIDIDASELNKIIPITIPIQGDAGVILRQMLTQWRLSKVPNWSPTQLGDWWQQIEEWRSVRCLDAAPSDTDIRPQHALMRLAAAMEHLDDYFVATNVGKHQMWAAQYLPFKKPRQFLTSGKAGTMGYGLPAGIGAQWSHRDAPVIVVSGDASWRMNTPEVETACRENLPVKVIMLNDNRMGMVDQWQGMFHGERYSQSSFANSTKNFVAEFKAQGNNAQGERITHPSQLDGAITRMMAARGPYFLEIIIRNESCFPMVAAGRPHHEVTLSPETLVRNPHLKPSMS